MVYGRYIYTIPLVYKPIYNWGGPPCIDYLLIYSKAGYSCIGMLTSSCITSVWCATVPQQLQGPQGWSNRTLDQRTSKQWLQSCLTNPQNTHPHIKLITASSWLFHSVFSPYPLPMLIKHRWANCEVNHLQIWWYFPAQTWVLLWFCWVLLWCCWVVSPIFRLAPTERGDHKGP